MAGARFLIDQAVALALPARCPGCGTVTHQPHRFCADCWPQLRFLGPPECAGCRLPLAIDMGDDVLCAACQQQMPAHAGVFAAVAYGDIARHVALALKYGRKLGAAEVMGRLMARRVPPSADLLVPVPLHRWRLWGRGFNQAVLIAEAVSAITAVPVGCDVLRRVRATQPLRGMGRKARARQLQGALTVDRASAPAIRGKHVVLVDDVHTSGATANACARALRMAGADRVSILCWARVLDDDVD